MWNTLLIPKDKEPLIKFLKSNTTVPSPLGGTRSFEFQWFNFKYYSSTDVIKRMDVRLDSNNLIFLDVTVDTFYDDSTDSYYSVPLSIIVPITVSDLLRIYQKPYAENVLDIIKRNQFINVSLNYIDKTVSCEDFLKLIGITQFDRFIIKLYSEPNIRPLVQYLILSILTESEVFNYETFHKICLIDS